MKERGPIPQRRYKQKGLTDRRLELDADGTFTQGEVRRARGFQEVHDEIEKRMDEDMQFIRKHTPNPRKVDPSC